MKTIALTVVSIVAATFIAQGKMPIDDIGKALQSNNTEAVIKLIDKGEPVDGYNTYKSNYVPLVDAAAKGFDDIVIILLDHGADVNKHSGFFMGNTAIMMAASQGHLSTVKLLLSRGANPEGTLALVQKQIQRYKEVADLVTPAPQKAEQGAAANP